MNAIHAVTVCGLHEVNVIPKEEPVGGVEWFILEESASTRCTGGKQVTITLPLYDV